MKKTTLCLLALASMNSLSADSLFLTKTFFVGLEYPVYSNMNAELESKYAKMTNDFEYNPVTLKIGAGSQGGWNMDLYFSTDKPDWKDGGEDKDPINELGYEVRYEFETSVPSLYPILQGGLFYAWQKMRDTSVITWEDDVIRGFGFKAGFGIGYYITENIQLQSSFNYKIMNWQEIMIRDYYGNTTKIDYSSNGTEWVIGLNLWF